MPLYVDDGSKPTDSITVNEHAATSHTGIPGVGGAFGGDSGLGTVIIAAPSVVNGTAQYINLTLNSTLTHDTGRALHIKCSGNFINNSTIPLDGKGLPGGGPAPKEINGVGGGVSGGGAGGGNQISGGGGSGGQSRFAFSGGLSTLGFWGDKVAGGGGGGGRSGSGFVGYNGADTPAWIADVGYFSPALIGPGSGGGASAGAPLIDGGNGGGVVILEVVGTVFEGTIQASGNNGANGSGNNGGAGGGGGGSIVVLHGGVNTTGTLTAAGGTGGTGAGGGGNGGTGGAGLIKRFQVPV